MRIRNFMIGLVNLLLAVSWILLGLRFILKLFAANPTNEFVEWVYATSGEILAPFRGIFTSANIEGFTIDFTALFGMLTYGLLAMLIIYLIDLLAPTRKKR